MRFPYCHKPIIKTDVCEMRTSVLLYLSEIYNAEMLEQDFYAY